MGAVGRQAAECQEEARGKDRQHEERQRGKEKARYEERDRCKKSEERREKMLWQGKRAACSAAAARVGRQTAACQHEVVHRQEAEAVRECKRKMMSVRRQQRVRRARARVPSTKNVLPVLPYAKRGKRGNSEAGQNASTNRLFSKSHKKFEKECSSLLLLRAVMRDKDMRRAREEVRVRGVVAGAREWWCVQKRRGRV